MLTGAQQVLYSDFKVTDYAPGTKSRLHLILNTLPSGEPLYCAVILARGAQPGPICMVTGLVHGDEFEGPVAIQDVFSDLDTSTMSGTFFGIPMVNGPAFASGTREGGWDHLNLARIFPGSSQGFPTERIAMCFRNISWSKPTSCSKCTPAATCMLARIWPAIRCKVAPRDPDFMKPP